MYRLAAISGGLLAALGLSDLAVSIGSGTVTALSFVLTSPESSLAGVSRSGKGDRLATANPAADQDRARVTVVEVVGVRDTVIVYRDREGRVLFRTDPVANVTLVAKNVVLPEVTVRERSDAAPTRMPLENPAGGSSERRLEGCDPLVSPLADSSLSHVAGRCLTSLGTDRKLAAAVR